MGGTKNGTPTLSPAAVERYSSPVTATRAPTAMATTPEPAVHDPGAARLRRLLLVILAVGILGTGAELMLLEHFEDTVQWIPLVLLALGLPAILLALLRPGRRSVLALRAVMGAFVLAGLLGLWFHFRGNMAFELEMDAGLAGVALFWETIRGATPALAPGTMVQIGLFGLLATYRHPALRP